ncbi:hypothetical protein CI610_02307 [invertebrate metagenome]|uniref:Acyltransferase 3 domain-containing protein n=1 Tax=invertebrate metagenome TaxID=1711999 RepID=A0A2H9T6A4_9ZZZZ
MEGIKEMALLKGQEQRNIGSDVVRIVLTLMVMAAHFFVYTDMKMAAFSFTIPFFFVTSGFLIAKTFDRTWSGDRKHKIILFYVKRFFRIIPVFVVVMFVADQFTGITYFYEKLFFVSNFYYFQDIHTREAFLSMFSLFNAHGDHMWYMSVLEQFYLVSPLLLLFAGRFRVAGLLFMIALAIGCRIYALGQEEYRLYGMILPINMEYFLWGALAYTLSDQYPVIVMWCRRYILFSLLGFLGVLTGQITGFGFTAYHVEVTHWQTPMAITLALIFVGMNFTLKQGTLRKLILFLSAITLSSFLVHPFVQAFFIFQWQMPGLTGFALSTFATCAIAILLFYSVEKPAHQLGRYVCQRIS